MKYRFSCNLCSKKWNHTLSVKCPYCGSRSVNDHFHDDDTRSKEQVYKDFLENGFQ